jgi:formate-dependent nitrite reductase membrane component NrfD
MNVWTETRFDESEPKSDGRHLDRRRAKLEGEAADQRIDRPAEGWPVEQEEERALLTRPLDSPTYYDLAPVKAPPWKWYIPAYLYVGGVTGAVSALGACTQWRSSLAPLTGRARTASAAGYIASAALLISDLGRPERFLYMLRVFRPTSPMNMGSWLLTAGGAVSTATWLLGQGDRKGLRAIARGSGTLAGASGIALSVYTAVLLANTAVPLWSRARRALPWLFAASSAASAASLLSLVARDGEPGAEVIRRFGMVGKAGELLAGKAVEDEAAHPRVRAALHDGRGGQLWRASKVLTGASLLLDFVPRTSRRTRLLSGLLGTVGAVVGRFAIAEAGKATASDPRATFEPQRQSPPRADHGRDGHERIVDEGSGDRRRPALGGDRVRR